MFATYWTGVENRHQSCIYILQHPKKCPLCPIVKSCFMSTSVFQEQYQYLYKAMLSLISTKENGSSPMSLDRNGSVAMSDESDPSESMESLV